MKYWIIVGLLFVSLYAAETKERLFVVERESASVAVIDDDKVTTHMAQMHNMNHGIIKFRDRDGYLISRDGYVVRFDPVTLQKSTEYKTSKSAIGFVIGAHYVAVANYDDKSVDILTRGLKPIQKIQTGSKNVGIKIYKNYLIFAQMDRDKVTVLEDKSGGKGVPKFEKVKEFDVGQMPFDAMIQGNTYIVGFFLTKGFGVIDLDKMTYRQISVTEEGNKPVLKIPHFGFWSLSQDKTFIPAVGDNSVLVYDKQFHFLKKIKTQGLPVFTSLSPDKRYLAVTFSGKDFPTIQIVDTNTLAIVKTLTFAGKVLHVRWSQLYPKLYVSVNGANRVAVVETKHFDVMKLIEGVRKPSGIFSYLIPKEQ